jgi:hypothetical protein
MSWSGRNTLILLLSGAAIAIISWIGPRIVPLYDGVGFPDEPYRYVGAGGSTSQPPTSAEQTIPLTGVDDSVLPISTGESGPQFSLNLSAGALSAPDLAQSVTIKAVPQAPSEEPVTGKIAGNVYHVTATSDPGPPELDNSQMIVYLRLPQGSPKDPAPAIWYRQGSGQWKPLVTHQVGSDIYQSGFAGVGDYAMVTGTTNGASNAKSSNSKIWLIPVALVVIAIIVGIVAVRVVDANKR